MCSFLPTYLCCCNLFIFYIWVYLLPQTKEFSVKYKTNTHGVPLILSGSVFTHKQNHTYTNTHTQEEKVTLLVSAAHVWVQGRMWPLPLRKEHSSVMGHFITVLVEGTQSAFLYNNSPEERITQVLVHFMLNSESIPLMPFKTGHWRDEKVTVMTFIWIFDWASLCLQTWILLLWWRWSWQISVIYRRI